MTTHVALIGAGQRSVSHMAALTHIPDVEVVALADLEPDRAEAAQQRANERRAPDSPPLAAPIYTDYRQMLDAAAPDCVYLCLPPFVHGQIDHDLIDYGKPILFEKPVAVTMSVANEIADHLRQTSLINAAGYQKRYSAAVQTPKAMLADQTIGMVISIRLSNLPGQPWWRVQAQSGGMLVEQHTHAVDLMRYLCGEIESVYAVGGTRLLNGTPNLDIFDVNACTVRFANGAPGIIGNSCAAPAGAPIFPPHLVHVVARDMVLSVNDGKSVIRRVGQDEEEILPTANDNLLMNQAFIQAVRSGQADGILSDYGDALQTLAVTLACQQSAETGQPVSLAGQ
ncbi:MAG: Gfo/Idh/MocA family oxidoreductase [Caldilineaceae bacterium]